MGFLSKIFKSRAKDWYYGRLSKDQVPNKVESKVISPNTVYVDIWLRSLRIVNVRKGLNTFYPVVHSFISIPYLGKDKPAEFNMMTTPTKLEKLDAKRIDRIVTLNKRMLGPIPYRGGDLELEVGLFSIKSADLAGPYLSLVEEISAQAGVSVINQALQFAEPLKKGINLLTGGIDDTILEVGLATSYSGNLLQTGYYVVVRAEKNQLNPDELSIDPDDFILLYKGSKVKDFPYLVFEITTSTKKETWWEIPGISESYRQLTDALSEGKINEIEETFALFKRSVYSSNDLITADKKKIVEKVKTNTIDLFQEATGVGMKKEEIKLFALREFDIYGD